MLLVEQSRFELAEKELHLALADQPRHPFVHSLLAICLVERQAYTEATEAARTAMAVRRVVGESGERESWSFRRASAPRWR